MSNPVIEPHEQIDNASSNTELVDLDNSVIQDDFPEQVIPEDQLEPPAESGEEQIGTSELEINLMGGVRIQILSARAFLNHALVHNQIPLVTELGVLNEGEARAQVEIHLEVVVDGVVFGHAVSEKFDLDNALVKRISGSSLPLRLSPRRMLNVEWNEPGEIRARLVWNSKIIAQHIVPTMVLSSRQWVMAQYLVDGEKTGKIFDPLSMEMLSAFVQPQHPAIKDLIADSFTQLQQFGESSFGGYQADPAGVDVQVRAIVETMRSKSVVYHNPEPGWISGAGQIIRTPEDVLVGLEGTCLDTTVVLAAALERIGLHPVIVVIEGHAFVGYWRMRAKFDQGFTSDRGAIQEKLNSQRLSFVETTMCTAGNEAKSYEEIAEHPLKVRLKPNLSNIIGVIDVAASRVYSGVKPVPAKSIATGEDSVIIYEGSSDSSARERIIRVEKPEAEDRGSRTPAPPRVNFWKNALLDLSLRNALINYRGQGTELLVGSQISQFEDIINAGQNVTLLPGDRLPAVIKAQGYKTAKDLPGEVVSELLFNQFKIYVDATDSAYERLLSRLQYRARTYRQETGANNLYLAIGMLSWSFKGQALKSPLILVPVRIERIAKSAEFRITLDDTGESTPNFSLLEKLRRELGIDLPEMWAPPEDQSGIDIKETFKKLQESLIATGVEGFHVAEEAHLAILQFSKFRLWKDLDDHWEEFTQNSVVNHLAHHSHEVFEDQAPAPVDENLDELLLGCPLPADGSQLKAISHALSGRSFVLEGPPGTGKSQTITNMLARAMVDGKRILFVAEKAQALSVVKNRLDAVGLGALALDVHDKSSSPTQIKAQILAALEATSSFDAGLLEDARRILDGSQQLLSQYADKAAQPNAAGLSLYEALNDSLQPREDVPPLSVPQELVANSSEEKFSNLRTAMKNIIDLDGSVKAGKQSGWRFIGKALSDEKIDEFISQVERIDKLTADVGETPTLEKSLKSVKTPADLEAIFQVYDREDLNREKLRSVQTVSWEKSIESIFSDVDELLKSSDSALLVFRPEVLDLNVKELSKTYASMQNAGFFDRSRIKKSIIKILDTEKLSGQKIRPKRLTIYIESLTELASKVDKIREKALDECLVVMPEEWNPLSGLGRSEFQTETDKLRRLSYVFVGQGSDSAKIEAVETLRAGATGAELKMLRDIEFEVSDLKLKFALNDSDFADWVGIESGLIETWIQKAPTRGTTLESRKNSFIAWNRLLKALTPLRDASLDQACDELLNGTVRLSDAPIGFENGIASASVKERIATLGLQEFDGINHDVQVNRYSRSLARLRQLMPESMAHRVLSSRPFDAASTRGRIAQLRNQVTKKRGGLTIRALFAEFSDIIPNLLPCVMTNPDSLARLFPPRSKQFDIVVFDEASQIRVAEAIGAMGRANSVIVVGDTRQMPPTSFARVNDDIGDFEEVESLADLEGQVGDQESLLDECKDALNSTLELTWHYRSQEESLIAFSNEAYYENRLSSFPTPGGKKKELGFGIHFHKVESASTPAKFLDLMRNSKGELPQSTRINLDETHAITQDVVKRFDLSPEKIPSVGIVTFNIEQRTLIEKALNLCGNSRVAAALQDDSEEGLFVKNIEFVQGDERDAILFSIGRTPGPEGLVSLTGFGPLTQRGGHRRFNVAITRARQEVHLYCSFLPGQLAAETATNQGVKDLKTYLQWARDEQNEFGVGPTKRSVKDAHRETIAKQLEQRGFEVSQDLGFSEFRVDLSMKAKNKKDSPEIAILLDGPPWRGRSTIFDRDVLPVDILKNLMGWPYIFRVWAPEWLRDSESVINRIIELSDQLAAGSVSADDDAALAEAADTLTFNLDLKNSRGDNKSTIANSTAPTHDQMTQNAWIPFVPVVVGTRDYLDYLPRSKQAVEGVQQVMRIIVEQEGPVSFTRLCQLTAASFGLTKVNANREITITLVIPKEFQKTKDESFAWPEHLEPDSWTDFRPSDDYKDRPLEIISMREIVNAMSHHSRMALGMGKEDLFRETLASFGGKRITPAIEVLLETALQYGLDSGKLAVDSGGVFTGVAQN